MTDTPDENYGSRTYVSIPTQIEAVQWTGENAKELEEFCGVRELEEGETQPIFSNDPIRGHLYVAANGAWLDLEIGEWILKDELGFYPCKDKVFRKKYIGAFDQEIKFHSDVLAERQRQVVKGYSVLHDAPKGIGRLIRMSYDFGVQGEHVKATAMAMAALSVITAVVKASEGQAKEVKI